MFYRSSFIKCCSSLYSNTHITNNVLLNNARCMAGHAKWQNVKSTKEAKQKLKNMVIDKSLRAMKNAIKCM